QFHAHRLRGFCATNALTTPFGSSKMTYGSFITRFHLRKEGAHCSRRKSRGQTRRLHLETLEDRLAPAILIPVPTHRDIVFDSSRQLLYVTTSKGTIERYDVAHQTLLTPWSVGTSLNGADITPDASALYVGENSLTVGAVLHKVNLADGTVKNLSYGGASGE